jgi:hypothetical protein
MYGKCHSCYRKNGIEVKFGCMLRKTLIGYQCVKCLQRTVVTNRFVDSGDSGSVQTSEVTQGETRNRAHFKSLF